MRVGVSPINIPDRDVSGTYIPDRLVSGIYIPDELVSGTYIPDRLVSGTILIELLIGITNISDKGESMLVQGVLGALITCLNILIGVFSAVNLLFSAVADASRVERL